MTWISDLHASMLDCASTIVAVFPPPPLVSVAPLTSTGAPLSALSTWPPPAPSSSSRVQRAPVPFMAGSTCLLAAAASRGVPPALKPAGARSVTSVAGFLSAAPSCGSAAARASASAERPRDLSARPRGWQHLHWPQEICFFFVVVEKNESRNGEPGGGGSTFFLSRALSPGSKAPPSSPRSSSACNPRCSCPSRRSRSK